MMATKTDTGGKEVIDISSEVSATGDAGRSEGRSRRAPTSLKDPGSDASRKNELSENGKKKTKEEKPSTKVVIRRLPPTMTKDVFMSQISPIPDHDYFYFVQGDPISGPLMGFSRAYINFTNQEDLFRFTETYDNYVFVDTKGQEYPAMVEFALFQRIPKQRTKKKDQLSGCIETDPTYISFKESLEAAAADAAKPDAVSKQHFFETEVSVPSPQEESSTPLLEFLKQKRADRARVRDERREEKKRKEAERKLRQKATKERKESEEDQPKDIKLLQPKDRKDVNNKDNRGGRRSEKEKPPKENRSREFKSRNNKNSTDEKPRGEKKEEKKKDSVALERRDEKKELGEREPKGVVNEKTEDTANAPTTDVLKGSTSEKKRNNGGPERRKGDGDAKEGDDPPKKSRSERNRSVRKERERKRRDDYLAKKNLEKKNSAEAGDRKRSRNFRNSAGDPVGNRKLSNETSKEEITEKEGNKSEGSSRLKTEDSTKENPHGSRESPTQTEIPDDKIFKRRSSLESKPDQEKPLAKDGASFKRRSSLESGGVSEYVEGKYRRERRRESGDKGKTMDDKRGAESDGGGEKTRSAVEDKASKSDQDDNKDNKDPRTGRRIRNKDRPSIQIYRPGMGKLSKQRLEKERTLGSSTEVDSPSHSPSPAPKAKPPPPPP